MGIRHKKITNIPDLIAALETATDKEYGFLASYLELSPAELLEYASFSQEKYTRNCIVRTEDYELLLLGWEPGQKTPIHSHAEQECWVHVVQGNFEEDIYNMQDGVPVQIKERSCQETRTTYMHDDLGFHTLKNVSDQRAMSLHLYVKPITECLVYNDVAQCFETVEMTDDNAVTV